MLHLGYLKKSKADEKGQLKAVSIVRDMDLPGECISKVGKREFIRFHQVVIS